MIGTAFPSCTFLLSAVLEGSQGLYTMTSVRRPGITYDFNRLSVHSSNELPTQHTKYLPFHSSKILMASRTSDPCLIPAMKAPPGLRSNLIDPPSMGYLTITVCVLVLVLLIPFVALYLYTRQFITRQVWWDDCSYSQHAVRYVPSSMLINCDRVLWFRLDLRDRPR